MDCGYLLLYGKADFWKVIKICAGVFKRNIWMKKSQYSDEELERATFRQVLYLSAIFG